ncbi:MAG: PHP domain-containing protein [Candidatus Bathycorpusculaceae bacterium]
MAVRLVQVKIDLHVHTYYSYDSIIKPEELVFYAKRRGLDGAAITDHDVVEGALKMAGTADFLIISGIEVTSLGGHIIGLNVEEQIPPKLSVEETVDKIHEAGGIAVACHPKAFFKESLGKHASARFDAIEVINSSAIPFNRSVEQSQKIASALNVARVAGSDAHYGPEIGCAYTIVDAELNVDEVTKAISKGLCKPFGNAIPLGMRLKREFLSIQKRLGF